MLNNRNTGFTLIEMMVVLIIMGIIVGWGITTFQKYSKRANLVAAKSAMLENASYLENLYSKYYRYNEATNSEGNCTWPTLPKTKVANFDIAFSASAPFSCPTESYIMYAIPDATYQERENRYIRMDNSKNIVLCISKGQDNKDVDECEIFK